MNDAWLETIKWNTDGLIPAIVQEASTQKILMMAWMNREALMLTAQQNRAVYWSRSRQKLWYKGEVSGHVQTVSAIRLDCDNDVVLLTVEQLGGMACHTGRVSCFYQLLKGDQWHEVEPVIKDPQQIYKN